MLTIKLQRIGKKHQPSYRLVVAEKRSKMAAPPVEDLGAYNPFSKALTLDSSRILHWIKMGAQPTATVHNLFVGHKIIVAPKAPVKIKKKVSQETPAEPSAAAPKVETPAA